MRGRAALRGRGPAGGDGVYDFPVFFFFPARTYFISKQISTVTITDRFSLTTHVVDSFMAVPKNRATLLFYFYFSFLNILISPPTGSLPGPGRAAPPTRVRLIRRSCIILTRDDDSSDVRLIFLTLDTILPISFVSSPPAHWHNSR